MIIGVACPNCGKAYDVPGKLAGRRVRCKQCYANFRVPVPSGNPSTADTQKLEPAGNFDEFFDVDTEPEPSPLAVLGDPRSRPKGAIPDLGTSPAFLVMFAVAIAGLAYLSVRGPGSNPSWAALLFLLVGAFALVSSAASWESFDNSLRFRVLAPLLGTNGAKFAHKLLACALLATAFLIFTGLVEWPFAPSTPPPRKCPNRPRRPWPRRRRSRVPSPRALEDALVSGYTERAFKAQLLRAAIVSSRARRDVDRSWRQRQVVASWVVIASVSLWFSNPPDRITRRFATLVVDPNRVAVPVLGALPGIGAARAKAIEEARNRRPFGSLDDFDRRVKGIGPAIIAELKPHLRFDTSTP